MAKVTVYLKDESIPSGQVRVTDEIDFRSMTDEKRFLQVVLTDGVTLKDTNSWYPPWAVIKIVWEKEEVLFDVQKDPRDA